MPVTPGYYIPEDSIVYVLSERKIDEVPRFEIRVWDPIKKGGSMGEIEADIEIGEPVEIRLASPEESPRPLVKGLVYSIKREDEEIIVSGYGFEKMLTNLTITFDDEEKETEHFWNKDYAYLLQLLIEVWVNGRNLNDWVAYKNGEGSEPPAEHFVIDTTDLGTHPLGTKGYFKIKKDDNLWETILSLCKELKAIFYLDTVIEWNESENKYEFSHTARLRFYRGGPNFDVEGTRLVEGDWEITDLVLSKSLERSQDDPYSIIIVSGGTDGFAEEFNKGILDSRWSYQEGSVEWRKDPTFSSEGEYGVQGTSEGLSLCLLYTSPSPRD